MQTEVNSRHIFLRVILSSPSAEIYNFPDPWGGAAAAAAARITTIIANPSHHPRTR